MPFVTSATGSTNDAAKSMFAFASNSSTIASNCGS